MKQSWLTWGILPAIAGALFMKFSKITFFAGMVIFFVISLTTQVSATQSEEANKLTEMRAKRLFMSAMCYLIAGIICLFI